MSENKVNCLICGAELVYTTGSENMECYYCKQPFLSNVKCVNGHYICDTCHSLPAFELIKQFTIRSHSENPLEMALVLMRNPALKMHGPEHHFLIPAVLLSAYYNITKEGNKKTLMIEESAKRAKNVLGGFCGFYGDCGAAVGTGIFISIITGATPLSKSAWGLSNAMTAQSLRTIARHGGPRCCKRNTFLAIKEAVKFSKKQFGVEMEISRIKCEFSHLNTECLKENCRFYDKKPVKA